MPPPKVKHYKVGRPPLGLSTRQVVMAVREQGGFLPASRVLGCSDVYIRLKHFIPNGLTLQRVLESDEETLVEIINNVEGQNGQPRQIALDQAAIRH